MKTSATDCSLSDRKSQAMDPQIRMLLELTFESLESGAWEDLFYTLGSKFAYKMKYGLTTDHLRSRNPHRRHCGIQDSRLRRNIHQGLSRSAIIRPAPHTSRACDRELCRHGSQPDISLLRPERPQHSYRHGLLHITDGPAPGLSKLTIEGIRLCNYWRSLHESESGSLC